MAHFLLMLYTIFTLIIAINLARAMNKEMPCDDIRSHEHVIVSQPRSPSPPNDHLISILEVKTNQVTQPDNPNLKYHKCKWGGCTLCTAIAGAAIIGLLIANPITQNFANLAVASAAGCTASAAGTCFKIARQRPEETSYKIPLISAACSSIPSIPTPVVIVGMSAKGIIEFLCAAGVSPLISIAFQVMCPYSYYCPKEESIRSSITKCCGRIMAPPNRPHNNHDIQLPTNSDPDN